ncbi:hypothetical protein ACTXMF_10715 [Psychrobacter celer]|uniref:hypothetical protein n=1 Tax=Psychrobacter celer TaxID=306572 RepID=UPI003FD289CF
MSAQEHDAVVINDLKREIRELKQSVGAHKSHADSLREKIRQMESRDEAINAMARAMQAMTDY